jgi:hypothetical protein
MRQPMARWFLYAAAAVVVLVSGIIGLSLEDVVTCSGFDRLEVRDGDKVCVGTRAESECFSAPDPDLCLANMPEGSITSTRTESRP